jgi:ABC-type branched-subunit amino acid transport system ATPase component/ABC-type branched-subunit amino acid transport system permease subunit
MSSTLILGSINGLTIGLLAVGLVLVYKANRFINLAHAQLGAVSAILLAKFVIDWHVSWYVAFLAAVGVGVLTGLAVERLIIRRIRAQSQSPATLLLVSIGVSQILLALAFVPAFRPDTDTLTLKGYPLPFDASVSIGGVVLNADYLMILALVPLMVAALGLFLRFTLTGKMIRGAASNPEAAQLCGVPIARVSSVTWAIAGFLSAITAILLAPSQGTFDAAALGPELLLLALGAAAVGGFVSVPAACIGGIGLGLLEQYVRYVTSDGSAALMVAFVAILIVFVVRGRTISASATAEGETVERPRPRVPEALAGSFIVRQQRFLVGAFGLAVALVLPQLPYFGTDAHRFELTLIIVYAMVGVAVTLVMGWAGQVSLGHFALVGIGAFLTARLSQNQWSLPALVVLCGLAGAAALTIAGLPALRLRGLTLAVTTLGLAVVAPSWLYRQSWFGSGNPYGDLVKPARIASNLGTPSTQVEIYYVAVVVLTVAVLAAGALRRSVPGRLVFAVRDNEAAAASFGVAPATVKVGILAISGFVAGAAGVLWADAWHNVSAGQFNPALSLTILAVPVIGGLGSIAGAVVGAVLLFAPTYFFSSFATAIFGDLGKQIGFQLALGGLALVGVLLAYPSGVAGGAQALWERVLARVASRRSATTASLAAPRATTVAPLPPRPRRRIRPDEQPLFAADVRLGFGGIKALDGATIAVGDNEIVGLIGTNGAGKTTLLNAISGTIRPQSGSILTYGQEVADLGPEFRSGFGMARSFQHARLFPGLTVTETIQVALAGAHRVGLVAAALGAPWVRDVERRTEAEARALVERFNLTPWADTLTAELSTGTRRICDLATQVASRPKLLLLDEPTGGVAQRECEVFGPLLRDIRDELECSILIVEHDMPMLMGLCDRVYAMEAGKVIAEGTPEEIRADPAVIASYLGTDESAIARSGSATSTAATNGRRRRTRPLEAQRSNKDAMQT